MIECDCPVCTSPDPRNKRLRTSVYLRSGDTHIVIDTTPDFRQQALRHSIPRVDAVLFTHAHADHVMGFDDIRRYNTIQGGIIPAYGLETTVSDVRRIFDYISDRREPGLYRPQIDFREISGRFSVGPFSIQPIEVPHDAKERPTAGFRIEADGASLGYVPDCRSLPDEALAALQGVDAMILDALRHRPHPTHLTIEQSVEVLGRIGASRSFLVHLCHDIDHATAEADLPWDVRISFDGLVFDLPA